MIRTPRMAILASRAWLLIGLPHQFELTRSATYTLHGIALQARKDLEGCGDRKERGNN